MDSDKFDVKKEKNGNLLRVYFFINNNNDKSFGEDTQSVDIKSSHFAKRN